jgi:hypothetical protein
MECAGGTGVGGVGSNSSGRTLKDSALVWTEPANDEFLQTVSKSHRVRERPQGGILEERDSPKVQFDRFLRIADCLESPNRGKQCERPIEGDRFHG